jgi:hypothetical protein
MEQNVSLSRKGHWLLPLPGAALILVLNLAAHVLYVVFYSHVLNPGHDLMDYQRHAIASAPYVTFIIGFPMTVAVAWAIAKRTPPRYRYPLALSIPVVYLVLDTIMLAVLGQLAMFGLLFAISYAPYVVAAFIGARLVQGSGNSRAAENGAGQVG